MPTPPSNPRLAKSFDVTTTIAAGLAHGTIRPRGFFTKVVWHVVFYLVMPITSLLARTLVRLDHAIVREGVTRASRRSLARLRVRPEEKVRTKAAAPTGESSSGVPPSGPLLVVSNHPGVFDHFVVPAAIARDDIVIIASDSPLWRTLPNVRAHLALTGPGLRSVAALRQAIDHLRGGGVLLQFPGAGSGYDPDPAFPNASSEPLLRSWSEGLQTLVSRALAGGVELTALPVIVAGVVSKRALSLGRALRFGEGATRRLADLLQLGAVPGFHDVTVRVYLGEPIGAERLRDDPVGILRDRMEELAQKAALDGSAPLKARSPR